MDTSTFHFSFSVPRHTQFVATVRGLAVQAARYTSCGAAATEAFAGSVEQAVRASLREAPAGPLITVVVRREAGPLEVLIDGRAIVVEP